jgi:hypothetical protein
VDGRTVARWEKKKAKLPGPADLGLRMLFLNSEAAQPESNIVLVKLQETISNLVDEDAPLLDQMTFNYDHGWEPKRAHRRGSAEEIAPVALISVATISRAGVISVLLGDQPIQATYGDPDQSSSTVTGLGRHLLLGAINE